MLYKEEGLFKSSDYCGNDRLLSLICILNFGNQATEFVAQKKIIAIKNLKHEHNRI